MNANANEPQVESTPQPSAPAPAPKPTKPKASKPKAKAKPAKPAKAKKAKKAKDGDTLQALKDAAPEYKKPDGVKTAGGNQAVDCGDNTAKLLRGKTLDEVYKIAARETRESEAELRKQYKHLNPGMQRMNLGNRIRGANTKS